VRIRVVLFTLLLIGPVALAQGPRTQRIVELTSVDGTSLKATLFPAAKAGPGVLLLHQSNRDRKSWDSVAAQLAASGIHTLTLDMRGFDLPGVFRTS
jgi:predicted alpha/beta hydrolase